MLTADITPRTAIVGAWRSQLHWQTILGELLDNGFDANGTQIKIKVEPDRLIVTDNGEGCPDLGMMLTAGQSVRHKTTRLGRYGIGFKQAVASAGDRLHVVSVHGGAERHLTLSWDALEKSNTWQVPLEEPIPTSAPPGTTITVSRLRNKSGLSLSAITALAHKLSEQYTPAIKQGRQLMIEAHKRTFLLQAVSLPELEHMRAVELLVGRKRAYLQLGLVPEGQACPYSGLIVGYSFRVIQRGARWGLGSEPTPGLLGWLDLLDGWNLSTNKERVLDEDLEALGKQIAERCADVIDRAVQRGYNVPLRGANAALDTMLHTLQGDQEPRKAKRDKGQSHPGRILPTDTGRKHTRAAKVQPGQTFLQRQQTPGLKIALARLGVHGSLYRCQEGGIIELNLDNQMIAAMRMNEGFLAVVACLGLAPTLIVQPPGQQRFVFPLRAEEHPAEQIAGLANHMLNALPLLPFPEMN